MLHRLLLVSAVTCLSASACLAADVSFSLDTNNTIPGTTASSVWVDGQGQDWLSSVFKLDLTAGEVYNDPDFDAMIPQQSFWSLVPALEWDTWFGEPGEPTNGIAGGAGDLGGGPLNASGTGIDAISVTWFTTSTTQTGLTQVANITLSDDAEGTWTMRTSFQSGEVIITQGTVADLPEPSSLVLLGLSGLCLSARGRAVSH